MIHLRCFRNHRDTKINFNQNSSILIGENGQGKTNILEAISYTCLTKSFYATHDATVVMVGEPSFEIKGFFKLESGAERNISVRYFNQTNQKEVTINGVQLEKAIDLVGHLPVVILTPEHSAITIGSPLERRRFIDLVLSQSSKVYLEDLIEYRKIIRHRNNILFEAKKNNTIDEALLTAWDESLIKYASKIVYKRKIFLNQFGPIIKSEYIQLTQADEKPDVIYDSTIRGETIEEITSSLKTLLEEKRKEEIRLGTTIVGPHRDDLKLLINGLDVRKYSSQGQHKTFLIALKLAEFVYLKELRGETPIVLLDDVFSELDGERTNKLLTRLNSLGQTFITTTDISLPDKWVATGTDIVRVAVQNGSVKV